MSKILGDAGEAEVARLLRERGYTVREIGGNYPVIDLEVDAETPFRVSVKTSQSRRHVRLGKVASISQLRDDDFVFAIMPRLGTSTIDLDRQDFDLFIIPGRVARPDALWVHGTYVAEPSRSGTERSGSAGVIVKSYSSRKPQQEVWSRWSQHIDSWTALPPAKYLESSLPI